MLAGSAFIQTQATLSIDGTVEVATVNQSSSTSVVPVPPGLTAQAGSIAGISATANGRAW